MTKIDDDIVQLADAYSRHNAQSNRLWGVSALLAMTIVTASFADGSAQVFGVTVREDWFFVATLFIAVFLNFAYCSSHIVNYNVATAYICIVKQRKLESNKIAEQSSGKSLSCEEFAHYLYTSNYNRFFPIQDAFGDFLHAFGLKSMRKIGFGTYYKGFVDLVYSSIPLFACVSSAWRIHEGNASIGVSVFLVILLIVFALVPWVSLMTVIFGWLRLRSD